MSISAIDKLRHRKRTLQLAKNILKIVKLDQQNNGFTVKQQKLRYRIFEFSTSINLFIALSFIIRIPV